MDIKEQLVVSMFRIKKIGMSFSDGLRTQINGFELSMAELALMKCVADNAPESGGNISITDIQNYLFVTKGAVSQMFGILEKKGVLIRDVDKNNRRRILVTLTPKGQAIFQDMEDKMNEYLSKVIACFGEDNMKQFVEYINRFADSIQQVGEDTFTK